MKEKSGFVIPLGTKCLQKNVGGQTLAKIIESSMKLTPRPVKITIPARLQLTTSKVPITQKVESIDKGTEFKNNPENDEQNPSTVEYTFDPSGRLIFSKNIYSRVSISGNCIRYRCSEYQKKKCTATLKTIGKKVVLINKEHNHDNKLK